MFRTSRRLATLEIALERLKSDVDAIRKDQIGLLDRIERGSTVALRADVDTLTGRVEQIASQFRSELGRIWASKRGAAPAESQTTNDDDELSNLLEFQRQHGAH